MSKHAADWTLGCSRAGDRRVRLPLLSTLNWDYVKLHPPNSVIRLASGEGRMSNGLLLPVVFLSLPLPGNRALFFPPLKSFGARFLFPLVIAVREGQGDVVSP